LAWTEGPLLPNMTSGRYIRNWNVWPLGTLSSAMGTNGQIQVGPCPLMTPNVAVPPFVAAPCAPVVELDEEQALSTSANAPTAPVSPSRPRLVLLAVAQRLLGD